MCTQIPVTGFASRDLDLRVTTKMIKEADIYGCDYGAGLFAGWLALILGGVLKEPCML